MARCIARNARRPGDTTARYGGEKFAVLLPATDEAGAMRIAEQIRATVQALRRGHVASSHHVLTVSIGVATARGKVLATSRVLVDAADETLYDAKDAGRNRVQCYRSTVSSAAFDGRATPDTEARNAT
ncbi:GGDEF domain-containing protein [Paraburkholderia sp. RL18-103-BIB-C]|uniref:GGDEF domain-containing protein n=1 Tax=unclassified Paraburkholderia TaxID=2615204 RepID=UPI0038B6FD85